MGLKMSPSAFSPLIEFVSCGFKNRVIYVDDVLVGSKMWDDICNLEESFCCLQHYNLKLNFKNCFFAVPETEYLFFLNRQYKSRERKVASRELNITLYRPCLLCQSFHSQLCNVSMKIDYTPHHGV